MNESTRTEIMRYINLVIEKRYLYIITSLCLMSVVVWGSYFIQKKYEATSIIFIERNVIEELVKGIAITPSMDSRIRVIRDIMLGRSLVLNVIRKLDLDSEAKDDKSLDEMILNYQKMTSIRVKKNNLVTVSFKDKNPALAKNYINSLVSEYVENNIFAKRAEAYDATKFLDKQVAFFKEKMDKGEDAVIKFRQTQGIYVAMDERSIINEIRDYTAQIEDVKLRKAGIIASIKSIDEQLAKETPFTSNMFSTQDLEGTIQSLQNRLAQLQISYTESYPEIIKLRAEIETLKNQNTNEFSKYLTSQANSGVKIVNPVYQELKQKNVEINAELSSLNAREKHFDNLINKRKNELRDIPESKKQLAGLEKERDSYKNVYEQLLQRLGQSEVSKQMEVEDKTTTFRIIEPAILPTIPVSPNRVMFILIGIIFGFAGGFGILFLLDYMDYSVKTVESLIALGLPILAIIPRIQSAEDLKKKKKKDILVFSIAGFYMLCIIGVIAMEMLEITYIEDFVNNIRLKFSPKA